MTFTQAITDRINDFAPYAEQMPGVVIIHLIDGFPVVHMSSNGLQLLGVTLDELQDMGPAYYERFFNTEDEDMADFLLQMDKLLRNNNPNESFSFFQQVKIQGKAGWTWHMSAVRIFMHDEDGKPLLTITTSIPIDRMKHITVKAERLQQENNFLRRNSAAFATLSKRERSILHMVAVGKSSPDIAAELFISSETVQTHRRNIKQKLGISSIFEFTEYARAFNLL